MQYASVIARNYRAQAEVLATSLLSHEDDANLVVLVIDGDEADRTMFSDPRVETALLTDLSIDPRELNRMLVFYNLMEMATAVKPKFLSWLLDRGQAVCFIDPDTVVYQSFAEIALAAETQSIVLTPHALKPFPRDGLLPTEHSIMRAGVFNAGFIAVGPSARPFLSWWHERLTTDAVDATEVGLFTDQRWLDFVPTLFSHTVCEDPGMNVAYWNVHERGVTRFDRRLVTADGTPIRFFHFSGFKPGDPGRLSRHGGDKPRVRLESEPHLSRLCDEYATALFAAGFGVWSQEPYRFSSLPVGLPLDEDLRRLYRMAVVEDGDPTAPDDPLIDGGAALRTWFKERISQDSPPRDAAG